MLQSSSTDLHTRRLSLTVSAFASICIISICIILSTTSAETRKIEKVHVCGRIRPVPSATGLCWPNPRDRSLSPFRSPGVDAEVQT